MSRIPTIRPPKPGPPPSYKHKKPAAKATAAYGERVVTQSLILQKRLVESMTVPSIAEELGLDPGTVQQYLQTALQEFRDQSATTVKEFREQAAAVYTYLLSATLSRLAKLPGPGEGVIGGTDKWPTTQADADCKIATTAVALIKAAKEIQQAKDHLLGSNAPIQSEVTVHATITNTDRAAFLARLLEHPGIGNLRCVNAGAVVDSTLGPAVGSLQKPSG